MSGINLRVEISTSQLLLKRLPGEDIEFFAADIRDLPSDPDLQVEPAHRIDLLLLKLAISIKLGDRCGVQEGAQTLHGLEVLEAFR